MRTIKFRVWDKSMAIPMQYFELKEITPFLIQKLDKVELMQFTGLKDKNGKEIYEGDIIRYHFLTKESNDEFVSVIKFDEYMWLTDEHSINRINDVEIIGNIYENPELLTPH